MQADEIVIVPMTQEHVPDVARIHRTELPDDFCSCLGLRFLQNIFYPHFLSLPERVGLVALRAGHVCGFVVAGPAKGYYAGLLKTHAGRMGLTAVVSVFRRPLLLVYSVLVTLLLFSKRAYQPADGDMELLYEAVARDSQRRSVGSGLVAGLFEGLREVQGYDRCIVKTLESTPDTNSFYQKNGFVHLRTAFGRVWYVRTIGSLPDNG